MTKAEHLARVRELKMVYDNACTVASSRAMLCRLAERFCRDAQDRISVAVGESVDADLVLLQARREWESALAEAHRAGAV